MQPPGNVYVYSDHEVLQGCLFVVYGALAARAHYDSEAMLVGLANLLLQLPDGVVTTQRFVSFHGSGLTIKVYLCVCVLHLSDFAAQLGNWSISDYYHHDYHRGHDNDMT